MAEKQELTPTERRALAMATELYDFNRHMLSAQIPGLARLLVIFAEHELRIASKVSA